MERSLSCPLFATFRSTNAECSYRLNPEQEPVHPADKDRAIERRNMKHSDLIQALKKTLEDYRLTRSEKGALKSIFGNQVLDRHRAEFVRSEVFRLAAEEIAQHECRQVLKWVEDVTALLLPQNVEKEIESRAVFSTQEDCAQALRGIISSARSSIDVCVFTITDDRITDALLEAARRRIKIRIITDDEKSSDRGSDIKRLANAGIEVRSDRNPNHMHHKFALFDGGKLLNGSYNWTRSASLANEENFVVTDDPILVRAFSRHFDRLWDQYSIGR